MTPAESAHRAAGKLEVLDTIDKHLREHYRNSGHMPGKTAMRFFTMLTKLRRQANADLIAAARHILPQERP